MGNLCGEGTRARCRLAHACATAPERIGRGELSGLLEEGVDLGHGVTITTSITNEAVADLGLQMGDEAWAVIKASDVMIGK